MDTFITVSSKGQFTLPARFREKLGAEKGTRLRLRLDDDAASATISRAVTVDDVADRISAYLKPGIPPLKNASKYYQKHRRARL